MKIKRLKAQLKHIRSVRSSYSYSEDEDSQFDPGVHHIARTKVARRTGLPRTVLVFEELSWAKWKGQPGQYMSWISGNVLIVLKETVEPQYLSVKLRIFWAFVAIIVFLPPFPLSYCVQRTALAHLATPKT